VILETCTASEEPIILTADAAAVYVDFSGRGNLTAEGFQVELFSMTDAHGPHIYKDTKPKSSSLLVFYRVYRLEIQSVMLAFSTPFVN